MGHRSAHNVSLKVLSILSDFGPQTLLQCAGAAPARFKALYLFFNVSGDKLVKNPKHYGSVDPADAQGMRDSTPAKISSVHNPSIQHVRRLMQQKKYRESSAEFIVEGVKLVRELSPSRISCLLVSAEHPEYLREFCQVAVTYCVPQALLKRIAETETAPAAIAVAKLPQYTAEDIGAGTWIIAEGLQDPGNLGTIIRTIEAAGCAGLIYTEGTVDPFAPKVVRASAGAVLRLPVVRIRDVASLRSAQPAMRLIAAVAHSGRNYRALRREGLCGLILGSEGQGLSEATLATADERITIPLHGKAESLNVAVAAAVLLFQ